jgi:hypothetical protein
VTFASAAGPTAGIGLLQLEQSPGWAVQQAVFQMEVQPDLVLELLALGAR